MIKSKSKPWRASYKLSRAGFLETLCMIHTSKYNYKLPYSVDRYGHFIIKAMVIKL